MSVKDVNRLARGTLESMHKNVTVEGEITGIYHASSGHCYLTLKDSDAELRAMIWRPSMQRMSFRPENGQQVRATGKLTIYEAKGTFQLSSETMVEVGAGALDAQLRRLREKYDQLGWFDDDHKQTLPFLPDTIGLVTSPQSAAVHDMLRVIYDRNPRAHVIVYGVLVQGEQAKHEIAAAIARANADRDVDVLVVGRGGGSQEDLWAFNESEVIEAIFHSGLPVVSAVGHEIDTCLSDLVADVRALTPTDAGSIVMPDVEDLLSSLEGLATRLDRCVLREVEQLSQRVDMVRQSRELRDGSGLVEPYRERMGASTRRSRQSLAHLIDRSRSMIAKVTAQIRSGSPSVALSRRTRQIETLHSRIQVSISAGSKATRASLSAASKRLLALSPLAILDRGYSITTSRHNGEILRVPADVTSGDELVTRLSGGQVISRVVEEDDC